MLHALPQRSNSTVNMASTYLQPETLHGTTDDENYQPIAHLSDHGLQQLGGLRRADGIVKDHVEKLSVAESLVRELETSPPLHGIDLSTLEQVENMANEAEQTLEEARLQVLKTNERVLELAGSNAHMYATYKRNRDDALPHVQKVQQKRQKVEQSAADLSKLLTGTTGSTSTTSTTNDDDDDDDDELTSQALSTEDGCKQLLDRQLASMQELKKDKNTAIEQAKHLKEEIEPLKNAVHELREVAKDGTVGEAHVLAELNETCAWYENVNRLICAVSGTSILNKPDTFGDHSMSVEITSAISKTETSTATLILQFEPNSTKVSSATLRPNVAPLSDVVASCQTLSDNEAALRRLLREARVRISGVAKREIEFAALKKKYVLQWNYGGNTKNSLPEAAAWLYVRVTIPGVGVVVEMRTPPDYSQEFTDVRLTQVVGVMGWTKKELQKLEQIAHESDSSTVTEMVETIDEAIKATTVPVDFAK